MSLAAAQDEITSLTKDLTRKGRGSRGGDKGLELALKAIEAEKENLERQAEKAASAYNKLNDSFSTLQADHVKLEGDFKDITEQNRLLADSADGLKKEIAEMRDTHKMSKVRSEGLHKDRSSAMEESRKEHIRNELLAEENSKLQQENKSLQEEREVSLHVITEIEAQRDKLEEIRDNFDIVKEDLISDKHALEFQLQETKERESSRFRSRPTTRLPSAP